MPVIEQQTVVPAGFDAAVFLKLATNPAAYQAKLDELNVVADKARAEQEKARAEYELVATAEQITDLLAKTVADKQAAEDAKGQAAKLITDANAAISEQEKDFQVKIDLVQTAVLDKAKELDAREGALSAKEEEVRLALEAAKEVQADAVAAKQLSEIAKAIADEKIQEVVARLQLINSKFKEFVQQVS